MKNRPAGRVNQRHGRRGRPAAAAAQKVHHLKDNIDSQDSRISTLLHTGGAASHSLFDDVAVATAIVSQSSAETGNRFVLACVTIKTTAKS